MDQDTAEAFIDQYQQLQRICYQLARAEQGKRMGEYAWLQYALSEFDIELEARKDGIGCWGNTFTTQTMSNEYFDFDISYADIDNAEEILRLEREAAEERRKSRS